MTDRRDFIKFMAAAPMAHLAVTALDLEEAAAHTRATLEKLAERGQEYQPKVFTADEWRTVRVLVDIVLPKDARSGSATDAKVPEFMDVFMETRENMRNQMRTGLTWLDEESRKRFTKAFVDCDDAQRKAVLDDIAWPRRARQEMQAGVRFFNFFGILVEQDGRRRPAVHGEPADGAVAGVSATGIGQAGRRVQLTTR
jgi:hypothetical protein